MIIGKTKGDIFMSKKVLTPEQTDGIYGDAQGGTVATQSMF